MMLKKIIYFVVAAHLGVLFFVAVSSKNKPTSIPTPIAVKTYTLPKPTTVQPKKPPTPKAQKPVKKKARDVMSEVQKNIAKIEKKKDNKKQTALSEKKADVKKQAAPVEKKPEQVEKIKPQYPVLLVQKLKSALHLPEEGAVRLEVTLKNSGEVIDVKVLSSNSPDNAAYLELEIPRMRFPMFTAELSAKKQHTFTLTFRHDD